MAELDCTIGLVPQGTETGTYLLIRQVDKIVNRVDMHYGYDYQRVLINAINSGI